MTSKSLMSLTLALGVLAACDTPVDPEMISTTPAPQAQFVAAQQAAATCLDLAPDWAAAEQAFRAQGFVETTDPTLVEVQRRQRAVILGAPNSDVVLLLGSRGGEGACLVGLPGMTPQQSMELALPWVEQFDLQTNAERGQGLAANAQQAWGRISEDQIVFVAAYKTWDILDEPGAAARLLMILR